MQCFLSSKKQYQIYLHNMNTQKATNKDVPTVNFFETDFRQNFLQNFLIIFLLGYCINKLEKLLFINVIKFKILKFQNLKISRTNRSPERKLKSFFLLSKALSCRLKKQYRNIGILKNMPTQPLTRLQRKKRQNHICMQQEKRLVF